MTPISFRDVKLAMANPDFRRKLPPELDDDVRKYVQNPGCACNVPIYRRVIKLASKQLQEYYPERQIIDELITENHWSVINCHKDQLEERLKMLPAGRIQLAIARFEDQVTVIINELDLH